MAIVRRLVESLPVEGPMPLPKGATCMLCHHPINVSTAVYGRVIERWFSKEFEKVQHYRVSEATIITVRTMEEVRIPKKRHGFVCRTSDHTNGKVGCFETLWNQTWRSKDGHLRRAIEVLHTKPGEVIQPVNDDHEETTITKGLRAPHAHTGSLKSAVISKSREQLLPDHAIHTYREERQRLLQMRASRLASPKTPRKAGKKRMKKTQKRRAVK